MINILHALSSNKTKNSFLNSLRKSEVEAQVEFTWKIMERAGSVVVRERDRIRKLRVRGPGSTLRCDLVSF